MPGPGCVRLARSGWCGLANPAGRRIRLGWCRRRSCVGGWLVNRLASVWLRCWPIWSRCWWLEVKPPTFYKWRNRSPTRTEQRRDRLDTAVKESSPSSSPPAGRIGARSTKPPRSPSPTTTTENERNSTHPQIRRCGVPYVSEGGGLELPSPTRHPASSCGNQRRGAASGDHQNRSLPLDTAPGRQMPLANH